MRRGLTNMFLDMCTALTSATLDIKRHMPKCCRSRRATARGKHRTALWHLAWSLAFTALEAAESQGETELGQTLHGAVLGCFSGLYVRKIQPPPQELRE